MARLILTCFGPIFGAELDAAVISASLKGSSDEFWNVGLECEAIRCFVGGMVLSDESVKVKCSSRMSLHLLICVDGRQIRHVTYRKRICKTARYGAGASPKMTYHSNGKSLRKSGEWVIGIVHN